MANEEQVVLDLDQIHTIVEKLFSAVEISGTFEITQAENMLDILLDTPDSGMVIGYHGETLEALQLITSLVVSKQIGSFVRVSIEVGDYKKNRSEYLKNLVEQTKEKVLAEQREYSIPSLKAWERRVVHMLLQDDQEVATESLGEGKERILIIKPKDA